MSNCWKNEASSCALSNEKQRWIRSDDKGSSQRRELRWNSLRKLANRYPLPRIFQHVSFQTHRNALPPLPALLRFNAALSKSFHQVILVDLPECNGNISTTWTSCDEVAYILLRVTAALSDGVTVPQSNTCYEPVGELDKARKFVPLVDWTCRRHTYSAPHFLIHSWCTDLFLFVVRVYSHTLTPCTCMAHVTKQIVCVSPRNTHTSSRNVVHLAALDDTTHGHSFLTFSWKSVFQRAEQPCEDRQPQAVWRFDGTTTLYSLWAQAACCRPGLQALHRRRSIHRTRGFTCQTLVLPPVDHSVNLWLSGMHRDAPGFGLRRRTTSCSAGFTTVKTGARSKCRTITSLSLGTRKTLTSSSSQDPISSGKLVALFSSQE